MAFFGADFFFASAFGAGFCGLLGFGAGVFGAGDAFALAAAGGSGAGVLPAAFAAAFAPRINPGRGSRANDWLLSTVDVKKLATVRPRTLNDPFSVVVSLCLQVAMEYP